MNFKRTILPNGLRVLTIPMPSFESATVMVMVGAGSRYETKLNSGISHFLEHMAFKGTQKRPSAMDISSLIDGMGGEFNAFTGKETTGYYIKSAANKIETCLDVLSDMLIHSRFDAKEIEKEKGVILEEINLYEDTPSRKIWDVYEKLLYKNTPMGWDITGEKEIVRKIQREDFLTYLSRLYSAQNMTVVVAGGINSVKTEELINKYFGEINKFDTLRYNKVVEKQGKPELLIKQKKTEQVNVALGVRTVPLEHIDRYPLEVLAAILGGGMSSRLFHEVREKRGLAYSIRTSSDQYQDCGSLVSMAGVDPKRVKEAVVVMIEEYRKISNPNSPKADQISDQELTKAKEYLKGHMVLELEDSRSVAGYYAQQELLEKQIDNPTEALRKLEKVTLEQVKVVAKKYFINKGLNMAVIGNFSSGQEFEKLLKL
jgi:predicted Zn-dependent peptidase